jgi:hypothetical protein
MKMKNIVIELVEPRVMMSMSPIASQNPAPILWKNYDNDDKPAVVKPQRPTPPPVLSPVQAPVQPPVQTPTEPTLPPVSPVVAPDAPKYLKARPCPKKNAIALCWKKVNSAADTVVVEVATDGQNFTTLAMVDADETRFCAKDLDKSKTYTFRLYALVGTVASAYSDDVKVEWGCRKK